MDTRECLEILELESVTSPEELKQAYRDLVQIWHPDRFHGNSRLEQLAQVKLKKLNQAYKQLLAYFDPDQSKQLRTSNSPSHQKSSFHGRTNQSENSPRKHTGNYSKTENIGGRENSAQFERIRVYRAPRKSFFGRLALFGVFCFFIAISCLVVYFILNLDKIAPRSIGMASEAMEEMKIKLGKDLAAKTDGIGGIQIGSPPAQTDVQNVTEEFQPVENQKYYEIHLDSGTIIMTEAWWQEADMVMYKQYGGSMGVEKSRVKRIVER
jgi:curved DNA-binding protein CbpA